MVYAENVIKMTFNKKVNNFKDLIKIGQKSFFYW